MRRSGRARTLTVAGAYPFLTYLFTYISLTACSEYGVPIEIKLWDAGRTPIAHMVDVTNGFGLKVLAEHNFLNDNNIAFSPYGLMGILVALYEGVDGESSFQIQRAMQLPWNRNIMRIGFRDIHRTLKTYFVPEEGFLAGLALNNENVTFNDSYKNILRFYGFDLDNELPVMPSQGNSTNETTTVSANIDSSGDTTVVVTSPQTSTVPAPDIDTREETTPVSTTISFTPTSNPDVSLTPILENRDITTTNTPGQASSETQINTSTTQNSGAPTQADPVTSSTIAPPMTTTSLTSDQTTVMSEITTRLSSTVPDVETLSTQISQSTTALSSDPGSIISLPTTMAETSNTPPSTIPDVETLSTQIFQSTVALTNDPGFDAESIDQQTSQAAIALTNGPILNNDIETSSTAATDSSTLTSGATDVSTITTVGTSDNTDSSTISSIATSIATEMSTSPTLTTSDTTPSSTTDDIKTSTDITITSTTTIDSTTTIINESTLETLQRRKKSIVDFIFTNPPYLEDYVYYRSYDIPSIVSSTNLNDKMFLANGLKSVQVTYMQYDTVLEHAYLPHLEASALRLPLDSDRYYLLVVLPRRGGGQELGRLLARMARESDLSDVYNALRPRRVRGIVPSFTVKGHVTLTTDLQKLGIRDVFEPRQRDFTPMTRQSGVYVRSIEQAVSVAIRKYRPDDHKKNRYVTNRDPVKFYATYPFLYFVMDSTIHVSLMAGKMVDPLNSRIL